MSSSPRDDRPANVAAPDQQSSEAPRDRRPAFTLRFRGVAHTAVYCGSGSLERCGDLLRALQPAPGRAVICSDTCVYAAHGARPRAALERAGLAVDVVTIAPGEEQKRLDVVADCYTRFAAIGVERRDVVLALGGGVVGDLFGFVAASYLRGLRLIQLPTTVVAQVDSSLGGKVGVDLPEGKNLVGAFKHPEYVLIDYATLATLPDVEWVAGTAEVAKCGVLGDRVLFEALEADPEAWRTRRRVPDDLLERAMQVKARLVQEDERETGPRMTLNYGHTLGHAIEQAVAYRGVRHGEAVGWGMAAAARLAVAVGCSTPAFVQRQDRLLRGLGLLRPLPPLDGERVYAALFRDKKARAGRLRWILPLAEPGTVMVREDVPLDLVRRCVAALVDGSLLASPDLSAHP